MQRPTDEIDTHLEEGGSLPRPGIIGRAVRLFFGFALMWGLFTMVTSGRSLFTLTNAPRSWTFWAFAAIAFHITPYVVNIGFGRSWRRKPQVAVGVLVALLVVVDLVTYGTWWAPPLGAFLWVWLVYFSSHLGVSFILSAVLGTPGCEMRAIPHLWAVVTNRAAKEHYCPGPLDRIDQWEAGGKVLS